MGSRVTTEYTHSRLQFLHPVSRVVGTDMMIRESQSDADDDDTKDKDDRTQLQTAANISDGTTSTVSNDAVDSYARCVSWHRVTLASVLSGLSYNSPFFCCNTAVFP